MQLVAPNAVGIGIHCWIFLDALQVQTLQDDLTQALHCVKWKPLEFRAVGVTRTQASQEYSLLAGNLL